LTTDKESIRFVPDLYRRVWWLIFRGCQFIQERTSFSEFSNALNL